MHPFRKKMIERAKSLRLQGQNITEAIEQNDTEKVKALRSEYETKLNWALCRRVHPIFTNHYRKFIRMMDEHLAE